MRSNWAAQQRATRAVASIQGWIRGYGIDGFRCDTADWVPADFWKEAISRLRAASPRPIFMLAEGFRKENLSSGFDAEYGWPFYDALTAIFKGGAASKLAQAASKEAGDGLPHLRFVTNHDKDAWEGTPLDFFRTAHGVMTATVVSALYHGGIPLVYTGQEVAWSKRIPIFDRSRVDWTSDRATGSWLAALYRLRRANRALSLGSTEDESTEDMIVFRRRFGKDEALVVANVRDRFVSVPAAPGVRGAWRDGFSEESVSLGPAISLPPYGFHIYVRRR